VEEGAVPGRWPGEPARGVSPRPAGTARANLDAEAINPIEAAQQIIDVVANYGLTKVDAPEPYWWRP
jgi:hypothetical protein